MVPGSFFFFSMPIIDRLRTELDRAGRAAQLALDEGRLRLELFRARQTADRSAQRLGYAVYHARRLGGELSADRYAVLATDLTTAESEVQRYETLLEELERKRVGRNLPVKVD
jgi:hypothetical protein